jgi:hypothetical protein
MEGMIRAHRSTGVHDPVCARALVLCGGAHPRESVVLASLDICALSGADAANIRRRAERLTGIPAERMIIAVTHTHSGPATYGYFNPKEKGYVARAIPKVAATIARAARALRPAAVGVGAGKEGTVSQYRRLLADDGHVVMNWEPFPPERLVGPLGVVDPELGVLKVAGAGARGQTLGILFNHAGHPNVLSGDNYLISADYPGRAEALIEERLGGMALFLNGAQGTMDIDGLRDRDLAGIERIARALADAVAAEAQRIRPSPRARIRCYQARYAIPARKISAREFAWAQTVLRKTGGKVKPVADGVGDDYKANLYLRLRRTQDKLIPLEQVCVVVDDAAFISFPGELFTEIGMEIKARSPFRHTFIIGLANGSVGYLPTRRAIQEGGYEPETRELDDSGERIVVSQSLALLRKACEDAN